MAQQSKGVIIWVDSDPNVKNEPVITSKGYEFKFCAETEECILYIKGDGKNKKIVGIITSMMERGGRKAKGLKNGIQMIEYIKLWQASLFAICIPIFAICSTSITHHPSVQIISNDRNTVQTKLIQAIEQHSNNQPKGESCRVNDCTFNHKYHFCWLCRNGNSDHRTMNCPTGKRLFHGTKGKYLASIIHNCGGQLHPSPGGRLGKGVYFTTEFDIAQKIGRDWKPSPDQNGYCVLECNVNVGNCLDNGDKDDGAGNWRNQYDSCYGLHGKWMDFPHGRVKEYCIKDPAKTRICRVTLYKCNIDADIFAPNLEIRLKDSNINMKKNITVGKIINI